MKLLSNLFGDPNAKIIKKTIEPVVADINSLEDKYSKMDDGELSGQTDILKKRIGSVDVSKDELQNKLDSILPDAFAVAREVARRKLGQRHYDVQLIGGVVLHRGQISEMKTGEGKTLLASLPLYLNALSGKGVQLVTVNDYLARVGAGWMGIIYHFLGLSTSVIVHNASYIYDPEFTDDSQEDDRLKHFRPIERKEAYLCDVVYGTNNEFGFDYLRDNMAPSLDHKVQRELNFVIVDEVDSILIDEARTPLIISAPAEESTDKYYKYSQLVSRLSEKTDYNVDEKMRAVTLSEVGISKMEAWLGMGNIYVEKGIAEVHHIEQALKAAVLFKKEKDYVVRGDEVIIVDEFTGRLMPGRRYSEGLHQAIEAKEGVAIKRESQTLATITFQNYFRMYNKLSGMTGTAVTEAEEFSKIYNLEVVVIPTNKAIVRKDLNDLIYRSEVGKLKAIARDVKERVKKGQPVLIGTISIEKNEVLAEILKQEGLEPEILNAKNHQREARVIAKAGLPGAITVATNMAGRGVDIILGGEVAEDFSEEQKVAQKARQEKVRQAGGLYVIGTERHESRRIDNQLRGRAGRQGDPGETRFFISAEDDLMRVFGGERMKNLMTTLRVPEDMPIENRIITRSIESAQRRVEGNNFDIRKHLVEYDDVINKHREAIYKKRNNILSLIKNNPDELSRMTLDMIEGEIEQVVSFHTADDDVKTWNIQEIYEVVNTIFPVQEKLKDDLLEIAGPTKKLEQAKIRTKIIEHLSGLARKNYDALQSRFHDAGIDWHELEKEVLVRSIDNLWIDHLESINYLRRGIGLRGYGQRDPLVEYKKEAYGMFNELNNLIQNQVVYSVYKLGMAPEVNKGSFKAPSLLDRAKYFSGAVKNSSEQGSVVENVASKAKDVDGNKVGRNDTCPCGSGQKYKKCHGK